MRYTINHLFGAAALGAALLASADAQAGGFALRDQSAVGEGDSFAGAGTTGMGLSAMFWNPAAVTQARGLVTESHTSGILTNSSGLTTLPGTSPSFTVLNCIGQPITCTGFGTSGDGMWQSQLVGASYAAYQINPNWYVGLSLNTDFGFGTNYNSGSNGFAAQQLAVHSGIQSLDINPIVGWKINDMISVGAGPRVVLLRGDFNRKIFGVPDGGVSPFGGQFSSPIDTNVQGGGVGVSAGITVTPTPWTEIALGYRSQVKTELTGQTSLISNGVLQAVAPAFNGTLSDVSGNLPLPDQVTLGARQRVSDSFTLLGTVEWTHWSVLQSVPFTLTSGPAVGANPFQIGGPGFNTLNFSFRDGWFFSVGGEYQLNPLTTLRAGVGYDVSPVTDAFRSTMIPDSNRWTVSAGITQKVTNQITLDAGFSLIHAADAPINVGPGNLDQSKLFFGPANPQLLGTFVGDVQPYYSVVASVAFRYRWDAPALITKY